MTTAEGAGENQADRMPTWLIWLWAVTLGLLIVGGVLVNFGALLALGLQVGDISCDSTAHYAQLLCLPGMRILADVLPWVGLIASISASILGARLGKTRSQRILSGAAWLMVGVLVWVGTLAVQYQIMNSFH